MRTLKKSACASSVFTRVRFPIWPNRFLAQNREWTRCPSRSSSPAARAAGRPTAAALSRALRASCPSASTRRGGVARQRRERPQRPRRGLCAAQLRCPCARRPGRAPRSSTARASCCARARTTVVPACARMRRPLARVQQSSPRAAWLSWTVVPHLCAGRHHLADCGVCIRAHMYCRATAQREINTGTHSPTVPIAMPRHGRGLGQQERDFGRERERRA